jgi:hypothetical protein
MNLPHDVTRRQFVARASAGIAGLSLLHVPRWLQGSEPNADRPIKVAAIITEFTHRSHAHVILENFLTPYLFNGRATQPGMQVASMYLDQSPAGEIGHSVSEQFKVPIYPSIDKALCLGGDALAVDAVLSIGEHGKYPVNEKGQMQYPRKEFFDQIVATFKRSGRTAPVFNDKHLSYRWDWAKEMYDTSEAMHFPLMAGSSVPLAQRRPPLELPAGAKIERAVSIHGGGVESYDFHALEVLQSMIEARQGGETGVRRLQFLSKDALWKAAEEDKWSVDLATAAMTAELGDDHDLTKHVASRGKHAPDTPTHGILLEYNDGTSAIALKVGDSATRWNFACQIAGESTPRATAFYVGPWDNRNLFKALSHAIQAFFRDGKAPYPVERTLLVSGVLDAAMDSRIADDKPLDTPWLKVTYQPQDFRAMREMGDSWKIITDDVPQHEGIKPVGIEQAS